MSTLLFGRRYTLTVGGVRIQQLRIAFKIKKTLKKEPNTAEIRVFNLSETTRKKLQGKGVSVVLSAGYEGNEAVIFSGDSRFIDHVREGSDWITKIKCGDGERAYQFQRFTASFSPGTAIADVIRAGAKSLGVNTGNLEQALAKPFRGGRTVFSNGFSANGDAIDVVESLLKGAGFTISIQNGALQVLEPNGTAPGAAVLLSSDTGLIGSPEMGTPEKKKNHPPAMKAKSLLQPQIRCGGVVELRSLNVKGQFRVESVEYQGDTAGQEWYTEVELRPQAS